MDNSNDSLPSRRPLASRSSGWAKAIASGLVRSGISPNAISVISIVFGAVGAVFLLYWITPVGLVLTAVCVQLRLLCNLFDGMVAIEGGKKSAVGGLYNEIPDRLADSFFIVALGYAAALPEIGWLAALAAAVTAYIRVLGGALGLPQDFRGPMAKQHRMATTTAACVVGAIELWFNQSIWSLQIGIALIAVGSLVTCVTRSLAIAAQLKAKAGG